MRDMRGRQMAQKRQNPELESVITCPHCGIAKRERMPTDACQFFYECSGCGMRLKAGRLLRVLLLRFGALPTSADGWPRQLLLTRTVAQALCERLKRDP